MCLINSFILCISTAGWQLHNLGKEGLNMKVYLENRWSQLVTVLDVQPREHETSYS